MPHIKSFITDTLTNECFLRKCYWYSLDGGTQWETMHPGIANYVFVLNNKKLIHLKLWEGFLPVGRSLAPLQASTKKRENQNLRKTVSNKVILN